MYNNHYQLYANCKKVLAKIIFLENYFGNFKKTLKFLDSQFFSFFQKTSFILEKIAVIKKILVFYLEELTFFLFDFIEHDHKIYDYVMDLDDILSNIFTDFNFVSADELVLKLSSTLEKQQAYLLAHKNSFYAGVPFYKKVSNAFIENIVSHFKKSFPKTVIPEELLTSSQLEDLINGVIQTKPDTSTVVEELLSDFTMPKDEDSFFNLMETLQKTEDYQLSRDLFRNLLGEQIDFVAPPFFDEDMDSINLFLDDMSMSAKFIKEKFSKSFSNFSKSKKLVDSALVSSPGFLKDFLLKRNWDSGFNKNFFVKNKLKNVSFVPDTVYFDYMNLLRKPSFVQDSFSSMKYSSDFFNNLTKDLSFAFFTQDFNFSLNNRKNSFIGFTRFFFANLLYTLNFDGSFFQRFFFFFNYYFINFEFTNFFLQQNFNTSLTNLDNSFLFFFKEPLFSFFFVGFDFFFTIFSDIFH